MLGVCGLVGGDWGLEWVVGVGGRVGGSEPVHSSWWLEVAFCSTSPGGG